MNLFSRLCIGTANWGREYNGARVSDDDQKRILDYAMSCGIDMIDTATAYGADWTKWNSYFKKVIKVNIGDEASKIMDECSPYCLMAHSTKAYHSFVTAMFGPPIVTGLSLYDPNYDLRNLCPPSWPWVVQVPYSLFDRRFELFIERFKYPDYDEEIEIHVRSIFLRGKILQAGVSPQECIKFCLCNPYIDRVIIGADSYEQFRQNVHFVHEWGRMEKHDEKLLDPRHWE